MTANRTIRVWARVDPDLYERIRRLAAARYERNESMVIRAALTAYLDRAESEARDEDQAA